MVFGTAELLENILLFLPLRQLLCVQRVNRSWQACIKGSVNARRALFLQASHGDTVYWQQVEEGADPHDGGSGKWVFSNSPDQQIFPSLNPIARELFLENYDNHRPFLHHGFTSPEYGPKYNKREDNTVLSGPRNTRHYQALHYDDASWRNMLIMQPPCGKLVMSCSKSKYSIESQHGLTFGDILSQLMLHYVDHSDCPDGQHVISCWDYHGMLTQDLNAVEEVKDAFELLSVLANVRIKSSSPFRIFLIRNGDTDEEN